MSFQINMIFHVTLNKIGIIVSIFKKVYNETNTFQGGAMMKISFLPKTKEGSWSVVLIVVVAILIAFFFLMITVFNQRGGDAFFSNLTLAIPMILAWVAGLCACITGLIAIIKSKSRAVLVFVTTLVGFLIALYGFIEVVSPH